MQATGSRVFRRVGDGFVNLTSTAPSNAAHVMNFTSKPKVRADRPASLVYMTPAEGVRLLQERARRPKNTGRRLSLVELFDSSISLDFSADVDGFEEDSDRAIDNYLIAHCSAKAAHREMCSTTHQRAIKAVGSCDEFWQTRQPDFKGVERKWRHLKASSLKHIAGKLDSDAWEEPFITREQIQKELARCTNL